MSEGQSWDGWLAATVKYNRPIPSLSRLPRILDATARESHRFRTAFSRERIGTEAPRRDRGGTQASR